MVAVLLPGMDKKLQDELKRKLLSTQGELEAQIKELEKPADMGSDVDAFDEETDEAEEDSANAGMLQPLKERYERIKDALTKIERGAYGGCEQCGKDIEVAILNVDPESRFCKECKQTKK